MTDAGCELALRVGVWLCVFVVGFGLTMLLFRLRLDSAAKFIAPLVLGMSVGGIIMAFVWWAFAALGVLLNA